MLKRLTVFIFSEINRFWQFPLFRERSCGGAHQTPIPRFPGFRKSADVRLMFIPNGIEAVFGILFQIIHRSRIVDHDDDLGFDFYCVTINMAFPVLPVQSFSKQLSCLFKPAVNVVRSYRNLVGFRIIGEQLCPILINYRTLGEAYDFLLLFLVCSVPGQASHLGIHFIKDTPECFSLYPAIQCIITKRTRKRHQPTKRRLLPDRIHVIRHQT